jgi:putative ABC transport system ATP-binding protein
VKQLSKSARKALADATVVAEECVSNIRTVKSFVQERDQYARFNAHISGSLHVGMRAAVASGVFNGVLSGFTTLVFAGILYVGVQEVVAGTLTVGVLTSFLLYALTIGNALTSLAGIFSHLMKVRGSVVCV